MTNEAITPWTIAGDDYDSPWKEAVEHYFPAFMEFFFPDANVQIDWAKGYDFLEQGCRYLLGFPVAKLTDYRERLGELLATENSFAFKSKCPMFLK